MTWALPPNVASLRYAAPEVALAVGAVVALAWDALAKGAAMRRAGTTGAALAALTVSAFASARAIAKLAAPDAVTSLWDGQLACDGFACTFRLFFALVTAFVLVAAIPTREARFDEARRGDVGGERIALMLLACLGMNLLAMGRTLLVLYVALELVGVASIALVALGAEARARTEAALKLAVVTCASSGVTAYGMSWLYGVGRSIALPELGERVSSMTHEQGHLPNAVAVGVACVVAGFAGKMAVAPFHMWAPDTFDAGPPLTAAFLSVGPQAAALAALVRLLREVLGGVGALTESQAPWPVFLGGLAVVTMALGDLGALRAKTLKRLFAYAGVAQAGMVLLAASVAGDDGVATIAFLLAGSAATVLGAFLAVLVVTPGGEVSPTLGDVRGLAARAPGIAAALVVVLLSLVGLPPFVGFAAKLHVFALLLSAAGDYRGWHLFLAVAVGAHATVSFFYCSRVLRAVFSGASAGLHPGAEGTAPVSVSRLHAVMMVITLAPIVVLGVWWGPFYAFLTRTVTFSR